MNRGAKTRSNNTKGNQDEHDQDFETLVRDEFKKLQRQYRLMEDARHAIAGATGKLSKQGNVLERLRAEKEDLLTDLKNAGCNKCKQEDKDNIRTILEALQRFEKYKLDISTCLRDIAEMESNVDRITQKLIEQRLKVQALYGVSMTVPKAEQRHRRMEDRLYLVTTQFDTLVSENKEIKLEINMMLKLRGKFYRRLMAIKKISARIKQRIGQVVYEATNSYDQRDDWVTKINLLRERNEKESKQHVLEIKEYHRILHHDEKIHHFLAVKNRAREVIESIAQRSDRKSIKKIKELDSILAAYKRSFRSILSLARSSDIESLVSSYLEEEQRNYAMFKYITDLNHETNSLFEDIGNTKKEIELLSLKMRERTKFQEDSLAAFDTELEKNTKILEETLKNWKATDKKMEEFGLLLDEAFNAAGCNNAAIVKLLGNQAGMRPHNICLCMQTLEHRISELTHHKGALEVRYTVEIEGLPVPKKANMWAGGTKPQPQGGPFKPQVHVTGRVDAEQDEEEDAKLWSEKPIYYNKMKQVIKEKMARAKGMKEAMAATSRESIVSRDDSISMSMEGLTRHGRVDSNAQQQPPEDG